MIENVAQVDRKLLDQTRSLVACADLQTVRFRKFAFRFQNGTDEVAELELHTSSKISADLLDSSMLIHFDLKLVGKTDAGAKLEIAAQIDALYALPAESRPTVAQMKLFGQANGMLNVWPYWREYVQSATVRAGLPPLTLPLFRVVPKSS